MKDESDQFFNVEDFHPRLREAIGTKPFDPAKFMPVGWRVPAPSEPETRVFDRSLITLVQEKELFIWEVQSLRELFRGDRKPPVLGDTPTSYTLQFALLELHVVEASKLDKEPRDAEMEEIYSALRRRPDGRSLGRLHDYMWQAAALLLGAYPLSQAEFEAIIGRLERSCRTFGMGLTSRNYVASLRQLYGI